MALDTPDYVNLTGHNETLINSTIGLAPGSWIDLACTQWATLIIVLGSFTVQDLCLIQVDVHQDDTVNGPKDTHPATSWMSLQFGKTQSATWELPLRGGSVRIFNRSSGNINLAIYGTTRQVDRMRLLAEQPMPRSVQYTGATTSGALTPVFAANDGLTNDTYFSGPIVVGLSSSVAFTGTLVMEYLGPDNVIHDIAMSANLAWPQVLAIATPAIPVTWRVSAGTTLANVQLNIKVIQS